MNVNVMEFGAAGDGKTKDTVSIQKAVDTCWGMEEEGLHWNLVMCLYAVPLY